MNWLVGSNGAGKTTLLEAIYLLSRGHSFRGAALETLIQRGAIGFTIYAEIEGATGTHALGMTRSAQGWQLRADGLDVPSLSGVLRHCAAICFEPGSHALIAGAAEERRRFLDWGVFHVEHDSLIPWREYRRALRQRNALLRAGAAIEQFEFWEAELERLATPIAQRRRVYLDAFQPHLYRMLESLLPELGSPHLHYHPGWNPEQRLSAVLKAQRERDFLQGHTRVGPHRADWRLTFEVASGREYLSRGQIKLAALACLLAQGSLFADHAGAWPILCLDDLASELDNSHQQAVFQQILQSEAQTWITATHLPDKRSSISVFHVEQGSLRCDRSASDE